MVQIPKRWKRNSWEEKARENPLLAIQTRDEMLDAPAEDFSPEHLAILFAHGERLFIERLAPLVRPGDVVFEYGCGVGRVLKALADRGYDCGGVDISPTMVRHARRLLPEARTGLIGEPPDACADLVFSYAVLPHISTLSGFIAALDEVRRLLRPGGRVALQVNCEEFAGADRTENFEDHSIHWIDGSAIRHDHSQWSGVKIGKDRMEQLLAERDLRVHEWRAHSSAKPRSVWVVGGCSRT